MPMSLSAGKKMMAERSYRSDNAEFANDDPFAELTRIMGHDPRFTAQEQPEAPDEDPLDDLALDMESELLGSYRHEAEPVAADHLASQPEEPFQRQDDGNSDLDAAFAAEFGVAGNEDPGAQDWQAQDRAAELPVYEEAEPVSDYEDELPGQSPDDEPQAYAGQAPQSLEDELTALLADEDDAPATADPAYEEAVPSYDEERESAADAFDYARAAALRPHFDEPAEAVAAEDVPAEPADYDVGDEFDAALEREMSSGFEDEQAAGEIEAEPVRPEPVAASVAASSPYARFLDQPKPEPVEEPSLEFVDIAEGPAVISDDLDIPEIAEPDEVPPPADLDDFEAEFGQAFSDSVAMPQAARMGEPDPRSDEMDEIFRQLTGTPEQQGLAMAGAAALAGGATAAAYGRSYDDRYDPAADEGDDGDYAPQPAARRSVFSDRKYLIGGSVIALALVAGVGAFALGYLGGENNDAPALVRAEVDPVKVRPENPGGAQVANQGNPVYDRVSGQSPRAVQEALVTTAEEPVDIAARTAESALPPAVTDETFAEEAEGEESVEVAAIPTGKSEERVEQVAEEELTRAESDMIAVAPRRVRTMVVRPDGTMAPREEPAAAQPSAGPTIANAPTLDAAAQGAVLAPANEANAAPDPVTPPTAPAASPRPEPTATQPARPVQQPAARQPAPQPQQVAAVETAPRQPQAAGSEWSMQIASQPTPEGAQATYRDLLQRYGSVLAGRGVQIVKADIEGKGTYYRVRIPSASRDEAITLCTRYKSAGGNCFVSK